MGSAAPRAATRPRETCYDYFKEAERGTLCAVLQNFSANTSAATGGASRRSVAPLAAARRCSISGN